MRTFGGLEWRHKASTFLAHLGGKQEFGWSMAHFYFYTMLEFYRRLQG